MLITLDTSLDKPLYAQIRDQIRERISTGALKIGERLDPSRELAKRLGVHRTTVGNAYADLEAEGLIDGTVGRGTFVSPLASAAPLRRPARRAHHDVFWHSFLAQEQHDDALGRLMASALEPGMISFATAHGSDDLTPVDLVRRATDAVLRREGATLLQYGSSDGYPPLKTYLAGARAHGRHPARTDELLITNGCQQSLDLVRRSLVMPGDVVVCENPTYTGLWHVFDSSDVRLIGVPVARGRHGPGLSRRGAGAKQGEADSAQPDVSQSDGRHDAACGAQATAGAGRRAFRCRLSKTTFTARCAIAGASCRRSRRWTRRAW